MCQLHPRPPLPHAIVVTNLSGLLRLPFRLGHGGPGGWRMLVKPELHLGGDVLVPDIAGWRADDLEPGALRGAAAEIVPDWVCEVLSPSTAAYDRTEKRAKYLRHGVGYLWLVDPVERFIEAFEAHTGERAWRLVGTFADGAPAHLAPFDAAALDLSLVWDL